jgi:hypothetical protein
MRISQRQLRQIILQEMRKVENSERHLMAEGSEGNPIKITPDYLNRIIKEEYAFAMRRRRLAESRRRRLASQNRKSDDVVYYY